ncbi:MAG: LA_1612 family putative O-antigen biosynthesis protein [Cyanobacteria bacterium J06639_16]
MKSLLSYFSPPLTLKAPSESAFANFFRYWLPHQPIVVQKIFDLFRCLVLSRKIFSAPRQSKLLIYDLNLYDSIKNYVDAYAPEILCVRGEALNLYVFFRCFPLIFRYGKVEISYLYSLKSFYIDTYIKCVKPKLIVTLVDNDFSFYTLKSKHKDIKTVVIQNARRGADFFETQNVDAKAGSEKSFRDLAIDYAFVHNKHIGSLYNEMFSCNSFDIGSLKNNHTSKIDYYSPGTIAIISEFRSEQNLFYKSGIFSDYYSLILDFLVEYASLNQKKLQIILNTPLDIERKVFTSICRGFEVEFIAQPTRRLFSSYKATDRAEVTVGLNSTLAYESAARGNKTAIFSITNSFFPKYFGTSNPGYNFAYPLVFPDEGSYWTNQPSHSSFKKILDYLFSINHDDWSRLLEKTSFPSSIMAYDPGNSIIKGFLVDHLGLSDVSS